MKLPIIFLSRKKWEELNKKVSETQQNVKTITESTGSLLQLHFLNQEEILRNKSEVSDLRKSLRIAINERINKSRK